MFADRLHGLKFFKGMNHYLLLSSKKFYDPSSFTPSSELIKFYSGSNIEN